MAFDPDIETPLTPISSPLLIEETARVLRSLIHDGRLRPGERLSERDLGARLGVSRTPLREALLLLASERLVEIAPRRGARVAPLDTETVEDVFPVLKCLERLAVDLACRLMDEQRLDALRALQAKMRAAHRRHDKHRFLELSDEFHGVILEVAANATLIDTHARLARQVRRAQFHSLANEAEWTEALQDHAELLNALESGNAAAAVKAVSRGIETRKRKALRQLART